MNDLPDSTPVATY